MGFGKWMLKRAARKSIKDILNAIWITYCPGKLARPDINDVVWCQHIIKLRYTMVPPNEKEQCVISEGLSKVANIFEACALVILAEATCTIDGEMWIAICEVLVEDINKLMKKAGISIPRETAQDLFSKTFGWLTKTRT